jgi:hypothetical protein
VPRMMCTCCVTLDWFSLTHILSALGIARQQEVSFDGLRLESQVVQNESHAAAFLKSINTQGSGCLFCSVTCARKERTSLVNLRKEIVRPAGSADCRSRTGVDRSSSSSNEMVYGGSLTAS